MIRIVAFLVVFLATVSAQADERFITLSSTTSTQDSGLFGHILPIFTAVTGITVHVVAVGTGQALAIGARAATPMRCWFTIALEKTNLSLMATGSIAAVSCTTTSSSSGRIAVRRISTA